MTMNNIETTVTAKKTCNFPDCDEPVQGRGLCSKHYWQATKSATPAMREKAASFMDPKKTGPGSHKAKSAHRKQPRPQVTPGKTPGPRSPEDEGTRGSMHLEDPRATADELFHTLGAKAVPIPGKGGVLYFMPEVFKAVWVDPCGKIQPASVHAGANKQLII